MKKVLICMVGVAVAMSAQATTKTVGKTGAQFTSIQAAIDSFTDAELKDGQPDVVEIIDSAEYNEQVAIGNLVTAEGAAPGYLDAAIALAKVQDSFTLRGTNAGARPKINPVDTTPIPYGVFNDNPDDMYVATLSYMGKDITVENIEIVQSALIHETQYGINGQAGNMTFKNVLFAHGGDAQANEALINFNNDANLIDEGFNNSYEFIDCTFNSGSGDERGTVDTFYFHGYSQGDLDAAGVTADQAAANVKVQNCDFLNNDTAMIIRGRAQANHVAIDNCYFTNNGHGVRGSGKGTMTITDSIFYKNAIQPNDFSSDFGAVETVGREQFTPALTVRNSLFVDNLDPTDFDGATGLDTRAAVIRIQNDGTDPANNPAIDISGNTFVNCPIVLRFADSSARPRTATVNNNIFKNVGIILTANDGASGSYIKDNVTPVDVLVVNGTGNIFDNVGVVVEDTQQLPNVKIGGAIQTVAFTNTTINTNDPFAGPPYVKPAGVTAGADLGATTSVSEFMLY